MGPFRVLSGNRIQEADILLTNRLLRRPQESARRQKSRRIQRGLRGVRRRHSCLPSESMASQKPHQRGRLKYKAKTESGLIGHDWIMSFLRRPLPDHDGRVGIELEPPDEEGGRLIDRPVPNHDPGGTKLRLERQTPSRPLGRSPKKGKHGQRGEGQLTPKDTCRRHERGNARRQPCCKSKPLEIAFPGSVAQRSAGQTESPRLRPKSHSTPLGIAMPLTCLPSSRSSDGNQGTS